MMELLSSIIDAVSPLLKKFIDKFQKIEFDENFFGYASNSRFGFAFIYPKTWDRQDPTNSDGNTYVNPTNPEVKLYFWGSYFSSYGNGGNFAEKLKENNKGKRGFKLLSYTYSGKDALSFAEEEGETITQSEPIEGWRYVYKVREGRKKKTVMGIYIPFNEIYYEVRCEAPSMLFPAYKDLFLHIISEFKVYDREFR